MPSLWGAAEPERPRTGQRPQDIGGTRRFKLGEQLGNLGVRQPLQEHGELTGI